MSDLKVTGLRCEYKSEPLGIETMTPRLSWMLLPTHSHKRCLKQSAYRIQVATNKDLLRRNRPDVWDTGKMDSRETSHIVYEGAPLHSTMEYWWKVRVWDQHNQPSRWSTPQRWVMGILNRAEWKSKWIYKGATERVEPPSSEETISPPPDSPVELLLPPAHYFRKPFQIAKPVKRALVFASALGLYELYLNNKRVGDLFFTPGWSDYKKRVYYNVYDVKDLLREGENVIGALLADGWYAGYVGWDGRRGRYGKVPQLRVQLLIEYSDGACALIVTDETWMTSEGAIREADLLMGESYDARREVTNWTLPGELDGTWSPVDVSVQPDITMTAYPGTPCRKTQEIKPVTLKKKSHGVFIFDLGQNMVGWVRLKVEGPAGTRVTIRHAEMLNPDGRLYTKNLRLARATDSYILSGKGIEVWEPRFTFHGFRYVEVTGYPGTPTLDSITGIVVHADLDRTGTFKCSNSMVNRLYSNLLWSQRGNYLEVPTDCPQRDERLGWSGDAQVFVRTATYNYDVASFFTKWLVDVEDAQRADGAFTDIAPDLGLGAGTPGWGDAGIICTYTIYRMYGDTHIVGRHYQAMARYIDYLIAKSTDLVRPAIGYGDWLALDESTPKDVIATAYFAYVVKLMAQMAHALGKEDDAAKYNRLFCDIKSAFNTAFVSHDGDIQGDSQTCYTLALYFHLLPEDKEGYAVSKLVRDIEARSMHLSTGFLGTPLLLPTLSRIGRSDVAYRLLLNKTYPSWGYTIKHGATTIWERWDGWTKEKGFQYPGMNSFNHYAYGSVGQWLYGTVLGIDTLDARSRTVVIKPVPDDALSHVKGSYRSVNGTIAVEWWSKNGRFVCAVTIPPNTRAEVHIPSQRVELLENDGSVMESMKGVSLIEQSAGNSVYMIESGTYTFRALHN